MREEVQEKEGVSTIKEDLEMRRRSRRRDIDCNELEKYCTETKSGTVV